MDEDSHLNQQEIKQLNIYSAVLTFKKNRDDEKNVTICILYRKDGRERVKKFSFPDYIDDKEILWSIHEEGRISVYQRIGRFRYFTTKERILIPTQLAYKLERLVSAFRFEDISKR